MHLKFPFWLSALLLLPGMSGAQEPPLFQVKGYGVHSGSEVTYHYRVINNSPTNIANPAQAVIVEIGRASLDHDPELAGLLPTGNPPVYYSGVLSITAPPGWKGVVSGEEEHIRHTIWWETTEISSPYRLLPGQTLTGFSVGRREVNSTYLDSHFRIVANGSPRKFSGLIEREDTTPPALSVSLSPAILRPNRKSVHITATIMVKDDFDPQPEIKLESIVANQPLDKDDIRDATLGTDDRQFKLRAEWEGKNKTGRIYTVTYTATDASGNKATATATVSVPHDQRE